MSVSRWIIKTLAPTGLSCLCLVDVGMAQAAPADMARITEAWTNRQNNVRSFTFQWSEVLLIPAGKDSYTDLHGNDVKNHPPVDLSHEIEAELSLSGGKLRYETHGPQLNVATGEYRPRSYVSVSNGVDSKSFYDAGDPGAQVFPPSGFVDAEPVNADLRNIHIRPLLLMFRPLEKEFGSLCDLADFSIEGDSTVADRTCVDLETKKAEVRAVVCVDPAREFVPCRYTEFFRDDPMLQIDMEYQRDDQGEWVPSGWRYVMYSLSGEAPAVLRQCTAKVIGSEINPEIPDADFEIVFPAETLVNDHRNDEYYILREGGEKRLITPEEQRYGITYERLLGTESGEAVSSRSGVGVIAIGILILVLSVCFTAFALRERRRSHASEN